LPEFSKFVKFALSIYEHNPVKLWLFRDSEALYKSRELLTYSQIVHSKKSGPRINVFDLGLYEDKIKMTDAVVAAREFR